MTLDQAADELSRRLTAIFLRDAEGKRPVFGGESYFNADPHWRDYVPFYEYFSGDSGADSESVICGRSFADGG